eukprot:11218597-Lingulodinium_polyedra.AAC.1
MEEASPEEGRSEQKGDLLNEVARNRAVRAAQKTADDLGHQMHLVIIEGRAAAVELEGDTDAA